MTYTVFSQKQLFLRVNKNVLFVFHITSCNVAIISNKISYFLARLPSFHPMSSYQFVTFNISKYFKRSQIKNLENVAQAMESGIKFCARSVHGVSKTKQVREELTFAVAHDGASSAPRNRRGFHPEPKAQSELA